MEALVLNPSLNYIQTFCYLLLDHGRQLTKTINYYTQKINVAKSASEVLKSIGINSPSSMPTGASLNSKESRSSVATTSNTSNVSIGGESSINHSGLVSPNKEMCAQEEQDTNKEQLTYSMSPSISVGEEALNPSIYKKCESDNSSKPLITKNTLDHCIVRNEKRHEQEGSQQSFSDPLLRRDSESESTTLSMSKIKDINISKVVEKCQTSM